MRNPFLQKPLRILLYAGWWILPGSIHAFVLWKTYHLPVQFIIADVVVSFIIFAILGLSLWYMVRYTMIDMNQWPKLLQNHLIAMGIIFLIWWGLTYTILIGILPDYIIIFKDSMLWRILLFIQVYLLIISSYYLFSSMEKAKHQELSKSRMEAQIREAEFNVLKAQINPHFLFNSLNSASSLTLSDPNLAREIIINISDFFRFTLVSAKNPFTTLENEVEHALLYLEIEKARFGDKIQVESNLSKTLESITVPSLILQPLVENAVKHGVYESSHKINIRFHYEIAGDNLKIKIVNDIDPNAGSPKKGTATGLKNVASRLSIAYDNQDLLQIEKSDTEFAVILWIPLNYNPKAISKS